MSLQIRNASGLVTLDIQDRITRVERTVPVSSPGYPTTSGFITVPGMVDDGTWLVIGGLTSVQAGGLPVAYTVIGAGGFTWRAFGTDFPFDTTFLVMRI